MTSDHGFNVKSDSSGRKSGLNVIGVLKSVGVEVDRLVTPFPLSDHHNSSLCSFLGVYLKEKSKIHDAMKILRVTPGIYSAIGEDDANRELELLSGVFGDIVLLGDQNTAFSLEDVSGGSEASWSHGGIEEQTVPFLIAAPRPCNLQVDFRQTMTRGKARNSNLWKFLLRGVAESQR